LRGGFLLASSRPFACDLRDGAIAVELFTIQCTTCRARLKVKDESVIGDILACPKCGSMVQVVPPVDWKSAGETAIAAQPSTMPATLAGATASIPSPRVTLAAPPELPRRTAATATLPIASSTEIAASQPVVAPSRRAAAAL